MFATASVKVMRSYDYCHFEVCLGVADNSTIDEVNEMRKEAMRLADQAVEQYKTARKAESFKLNLEEDFRVLRKKADVILENIPKSEWTPEQQAVVKKAEDHLFHSFNYDYEDDFDAEGNFR